MKELALHVTAISLLLAGTAAAADLRRPMPVKAPALAPVVYNWTGCYVGAGGGYGMFVQEARFLDSGVPEGLSNDVGGRGWFGTVQIGCDYQVGSNIVIGAFADYDFSGIKGDWAGTVSTADSSAEEKLRSSWAAGGRNRLAAVPATAGFRLGRLYAGAVQPDAVCTMAITGALDTTAVAKHTYSGWFIGTGYEYGLGWFPGLFWKTEYRFADYRQRES